MKLGDICDFRSGFAFKSNKFTKIGEPIIRISDIQNEEIDDSNLVYFDPKSYTEDLSKYLIYPDDILIAMSGGTTGKLGINTSNRTLYLNQRVGVFRENKKYLNHRYLYYYLHTKSEESLRIAAGAAQPNLSTAQIKSFIIPVPPLSEQQSIVDYLDSAFAKIDAMKANAEKALNEAKALFQASLKKMLEPKEGWEEKKVGEIAEIKGGKRLPKGEKLLTEPTTHKYIRVADFNEYGTVDLDDIRYISDNVYEQIKRYIINKEDIYISIAGTIGKSGIIPEELDGANLTENACRLILSKEINQRFMYYATISPEFIRQEIESTKISAQPKLALTRLADILIAYPSITEQQNIVITLDSLKSKVYRLQENFDKISQECDALKQAILRQVFE